MSTTAAAAEITILLTRSCKSIYLKAHRSATDKISLQTLQQIRFFAPFASWLQNLDNEILASQNSLALSASKEESILVHGVQVQDVDCFGTGGLGFVKFTADAEFSSSRTKLPGIVFMRGGSVAILFIVKPTPQAELCGGITGEQPINENETEEDISYVILTRQARLAVPSFGMLELPAGMLDGSGNLAGIAVQEIKEELGIEIDGSKLINLTQLPQTIANKNPSNPNNPNNTSNCSYKSRSNEKDICVGLYPSAGGCDEDVHLMAYETEMSLEDIDALKSRLGGLRNHGERISLCVVKMSDLWQSTHDLKATSALYLWNKYKNIQDKNLNL